MRPFYHLTVSHRDDLRVPPEVQSGRRYGRDDAGVIEYVFDEAPFEFVVLPMNEVLFDWSFELILDDDLRTLDSLQLAAALSLTADRSNLQFVCADETLVSVARSHELDVSNPVAE